MDTFVVRRHFFIETLQIWKIPVSTEIKSCFCGCHAAAGIKTRTRDAQIKLTYLFKTD